MKRDEAIDVLWERYDPQYGDEKPEGPFEQWAALAIELDQANSKANTTGCRLDTFETEAAALTALEDWMLEGWTPEALFDLDTQERIDLRVAVLIARSGDQGVMENPLTEEVA